MLWYLPLEPLEQRYTIEMHRLILLALKSHGVAYEVVNGTALTAGIETGAFLDSEGTNFWKMGQIQRVAALFKAGRIKDGDQFFVSDLWFPGLEAIPYMAFFRKIAVEVWGIFHAGSWTDTDFVRQMEGWAANIERGWLQMVEGVFVGSEFHRRDIIAKRGGDPMRIHSTGLVFDTSAIRQSVEPKPKRDLVVFAGRLDDEKQPWLFDELAERIGGSVEFVKTYELGLSKRDYYQLLSEAKVVFSAALQENFGYSMLEAATLAVSPVVPDRLAYSEMWPEQCRYKTMDEAEAKTRVFLRDPCVAAFQVPEWFDSSFDRMLGIMRGVR